MGAARCGTRRLLVPGAQNHNVQTIVSFNQEPVTAGALDLSTPANLPAGCRVEEWVASVVPRVQRGSLLKDAAAALAYRDH